MSAKKWKSVALWPPSAGVPNNESTDDHDEWDQAQAVCRMLERDGLGGEGKIFPTHTLVERGNARPERPTRTDREIVDQTNELARKFCLMLGYKTPPDMKFYDEYNARARQCWDMACEAQDLLTKTDANNAIDELGLGRE